MPMLLISASKTCYFDFSRKCFCESFLSVFECIYLRALEKGVFQQSLNRRTSISLKKKNHKRDNIDFDRFIRTFLIIRESQKEFFISVLSEFQTQSSVTRVLTSSMKKSFGSFTLQVKDSIRDSLFPTCSSKPW